MTDELMVDHSAPQRSVTVLLLKMGTILQCRCIISFSTFQNKCDEVLLPLLNFECCSSEALRGGE